MTTIQIVSINVDTLLTISIIQDWTIFERNLFMREFAKISPTFWFTERGRAIKKLGIEAQLLSLYLLTNPHASMIGIYYLPIALIAHETCIPKENVLYVFQLLSQVDYCTYDELSEYVWVHDMAFSQVGSQLKQNDNRVRGVNAAYQLLPDLPFLPAFFEKYQYAFYLKNRNLIEAPSKPLASKEKDNEKENEKEKNKYLSGKPDVDPLLFNTLKTNEANHHIPLEQNQTDLKSQAIEILQFLNKKTGRIYRPVDTNLKLIIARLKTGVTVMDCRQVIVKKTREWKGNPKMAEYLRPATLFKEDKFEQYLGELVLAEEGPSNG
jgi:uncharacterized phage protein (TIGR02220 family)